MTNALSQYFPFLDQQGKQQNEALSSTFAIASVGIAMLKMLETLLPAAASEVERESRSIADHFSTLTNHINAQGNVPAPVSEAISGIIMGMQFQDRNTQVMDNVAGMLERYRSMLQDIDAMRDGEDTNGHTVAHAVEDILSSIRLSDIRTRYLEALAKAKVHSSAEVLPIPVQNVSDDIELF
jgi:hypothetical protein